MKTTLVLLCVLTLGACGGRIGSGNEINPDYAFPPGTKRVVAPGNNIAWALPISMDDGTKCVLVVKNTSGTAIACDFKH